MSIIKRVINNLGIFVLILGGAFIYLSNTESSPANSQTTDSSTAEILMADTDLSTNQLLDVPLEDQYGGEIMMENGCEITALSMLLNYYGYETDKNELVDLLDFVPLYEDAENEIHGNPHDGFVGNIYEGYEAMGVAVEPIAEVANEVVQDNQRVVANNDTSFDELINVVQVGTPVWVITTVDFQVPTEDDFRTWQTTSGEIEVSPLCHAVVITGVDEENVYVNDPYGYKNRVVDRSDFEEIYRQMGTESLFLVEK